MSAACAMLSLIAIIMVDSEGGTGLREFSKCRFVITALQKFSKSRPHIFGTTFVVTTNIHCRKRKEEQFLFPFAAPSSSSSTMAMTGEHHLSCRYH